MTTSETTPIGQTPSITMRLTPHLLTEIDNWRSVQRPIPSRSEAIRHFAEIGLQSVKAKTAEA